MSVVFPVLESVVLMTIVVIHIVMFSKFRIPFIQLLFGFLTFPIAISLRVEFLSPWLNFLIFAASFLQITDAVIGAFE